MKHENFVFRKRISRPYHHQILKELSNEWGTTPQESCRLILDKGLHLEKQRLDGKNKTEQKAQR